MNTTDHKKTFSHIEILEDETDGLIKLSTIKRIGQDRNTKIVNNFTGHLTKSNAGGLHKIVKLLNDKLPPKQENEVVAGLITSGIVMSSTLAYIRGSSFNYSTYGNFEGRDSAFNFSESHRDDKSHYFYGINKGDNVIIIEDEVTTGSGVVLLVKALREYGASVNSVCSVIETTNFSARKNIRDNTKLELKSLMRIKLLE